MQTRETPREDVDHVRYHCAPRRGHDSNARRKARQRTLARLLEKPFGGKLLLELLEGELQCAVPLQLERLDLHLVFAASLIYIDAPARQDGRAVLRFELEKTRGRPEADASQLRF